jgi:uncharacterized protein (DUF1330 family)
MSSYIVVDVTVTDPQGYTEYIGKVGPLLEKHGGKVTHRLGNIEAIEGAWQPNTLVLIEFPDRAAAKAFNEDPDYPPIKELRLRSTTGNLLIADGA